MIWEMRSKGKKSEWKEMYVLAQVTAPQWTSTWCAGWKASCHKAKRLSVDQYREPMDNRKIIDCASWHSFPCWWATQPSHCQPLQAPLLLGLLLLSNTGSLPQSLARLIRFLSWEKTRRLKRSASLRWIPEIDVLFASARSIFLFSLTSFGFLKEL